MHYLRFGEIPQNEKSINFLKMTFEQQEDFNYFCNEEGDISRALECVPADALEDGVSVFEIAPNGLPALPNLQLVTSLLARLKMPIYEVAGTEIGRGKDGEPLINNIENVQRVSFDSDALVSHCLDVLRKNFKNVVYSEEYDTQGHKLLSFCSEMKLNTRTGEKVSIWQSASGDDWEVLPPVTEYTLDGWTFSDPVEGFDVELGAIQ